MSGNQPFLSRWSVVREAMNLFVAALSVHDDQAGQKTEDGEEDKGGLRTITFAAGSAVDCGTLRYLRYSFVTLYFLLATGDWRKDNLNEEFSKVTARLGGGTEIVPGMSLSFNVFFII